MMYQRAVFCLAVLIGVSANAQTINLRGVVTNGLKIPIANVSITLVRQALQTTSAVTTGAYSITRSTAVQLPALPVQTGKIVLNKGVLELSLPNPDPIAVEVFDIKGNLLKKELAHNAAAGACRINLADNTRAASLLVVKLSIGKRVVSFRYMPLNTGRYLVNPSGESSPLVPASGNELAVLAAAVDSLRATVTGYTSKTIPVSTYDSTVNIVLDSVPGPSSGCGKLTSIASYQRGTVYSITSAGLSRRYIISIPTNYDRNTPYRLVFAMHCMCGSMWSVNSENFYEYKKVADSAKVPCIFVAPSCYNGGNYDQSTWGCPVWDQGTKDHQFFDDMLKLFKDSLCVDTTRVFCAGFSFGAMFTNSLAQTHQRQLRAVVCYAAANYNIYVPQNIGLPIAYMGTVGLHDGTCPPAAGRACRDTMVKYNSPNHVVIPETATEVADNTLSHVVYDYKNVDHRYPVRWCTFDSDHQWSPVDGHHSGYYDANATWTPWVAWPFLMQF